MRIRPSPASGSLPRLAVLTAYLAGALAASPAAASSRVAPVCRELANVFYVIARYEERGDTKESQLVWLREEFSPNEETSPLPIFDRALDHVYTSEADPKEIRASVMDHCVVDARGQAIVRLPGL